MGKGQRGERNGRGDFIIGGEVSSQFEGFSRYAKGDYLAQASKTLQLFEDSLDLSYQKDCPGYQDLPKKFQTR